jgi:hypothetical protein
LRLQPFVSAGRASSSLLIGRRFAAKSCRSNANSKAAMRALPNLHIKLMLSSIETASDNVLGSIMRTTKGPLAQWAALADLEDLILLVKAIPSLDWKAGKLILNVVCYPPHAIGLHDLVIGIANNPDTSTRVKRYVPLLLREHAGILFQDTIHSE